MIGSCFLNVSLYKFITSNKHTGLISILRIYLFLIAFKFTIKAYVFDSVCQTSKTIQPSYFLFAKLSLAKFHIHQTRSFVTFVKMTINGFPVFIVALLIADGCLQGRYLLVDIKDNGTENEDITGIDTDNVKYGNYHKVLIKLDLGYNRFASIISSL